MDMMLVSFLKNFKLNWIKSINFALNNIIMASIKNLKKDIDYTLGDILDITNLTAQLNPNVDLEKSEAIRNEIFTVYDDLIGKVNAKNVANKKAHFKGISVELETKANALLDKVNSL